MQNVSTASADADEFVWVTKKPKLSDADDEHQPHPDQQPRRRSDACNVTRCDVCDAYFVSTRDADDHFQGCDHKIRSRKVMDDLDEALKTSKDENNDQGQITATENQESGKIFPEQPKPEQDLELEPEPEAKPVAELVLVPETETVAETDGSSKNNLVVPESSCQSNPEPNHEESGPNQDLVDQIPEIKDPEESQNEKVLTLEANDSSTAVGEVGQSSPMPEQPI